MLMQVQTVNRPFILFAEATVRELLRAAFAPTSTGSTGSAGKPA